MRNAATVEQLRLTRQQNFEFETAVSAAVKRHHEEELQVIKDNLAKIVSDARPVVLDSNTNIVM